jgi:hypothetical protein
MTAPTTNVTTTVFRPDGSIDFKARLTARLAYPDVDAGLGYMLPSEITAVADPITGVITLAAWPNELGQRASFYNIILEGQDRTERTTMVVPNVSTVTLEAIAAVPAYPGKPDGQVVVDEAVAAGAIAIAKAAEAAASAGAAAGSAGAASGSAAAAAAAAALSPYSGPTAPLNPVAGKEWFNTTNGRRYQWVVDADSSQWVEAGSLAYVDDPVSASAAQAAAAAAALSAAAAAAAAAFKLQTWALTQAFSVTAATRNSDGAITTASIVWPDGTTGTYTADTLSAAFPGATDAWHATYNSVPAKTATQPAVTRDGNGAVIAQPAITIV